MQTHRRRVLIMGAAGRDFHDFNTVFRDDLHSEVVAFTAAQIPNISGRRYPPELAGTLYPDGIPIFPESTLAEHIKELAVEEVVFAYSDVTNQNVMRAAALSASLGADFRLLGTKSTFLESTKPVVSVCAVRTGCGKSQTARVVADLLAAEGKRVAVIRHPMPYGDLVLERCQRFAKLSDLDEQRCTIEEREEYELHIKEGHLLFAGVDYAQILAQAEREADLILWDGGNNDLPFYRPDFHIVLVDPLRPGDELLYYPSEANLRLADLVLVAKCGSAERSAIELVEKNVRAVNPRAAVLRSDSVVTVPDPSLLRGKRVLVVEDGPTLTHGGMAYGAGTVAARQFGATSLVDPRPYVVGSLKKVFDENPHLGPVLPAMGYSEEQVRELGETMDRAECDLVVVGTPFDLSRITRTAKPTVRVSYTLDPATQGHLEALFRDKRSLDRRF